MKTVRHDKPGYFPTPPGTCFIKPDLPLGAGTRGGGKNWHPFIVISEDQDSVECLMGRTLYDAATGKDRTWKLDKIAGAMEITNPCPPMDKPERRRQYVDASQVICVPKAVLYASTDVEICSVYGTQLDQEQTRALASAARKQSTSRFASYVDPYDMAHNDYPIDKFLPGRHDRPLPATPEAAPDTQELSR